MCKQSCYRVRDVSAQHLQINAIVMELKSEIKYGHVAV